MNTITDDQVASDPRPRQRYLIHIALFLMTLVTTTYAGLSFVGPPEAFTSFETMILSFHRGLPFSILLLAFLSAHEFGHYIAARIHGVDATLPFFIPMPFLFGTMGAVIRTRSPIPNRKALFDIGVAGPLAGFVVALVYLILGALTSSDISVIHVVHPEYVGLQSIPAHGLYFGDFALFAIVRHFLVPDGAFFPPLNEIYHYPLLAIGWFGMFVTALNLIPVGQLDGGHILYAMIGGRQAMVSTWVWRAMVVAGLGGVGFLLYEATAAYDPNPFFNAVAGALHGPLQFIGDHAGWWYRGWTGWLFWAVVLRFVIRIGHPAIEDQTPIGRGRTLVGWLAMAIFLLTISWTGIYEVQPPASAIIRHP